VASRTIVLVAFGGLSLVGLGTGIYLGVQANNEQNTANSLNNQRGTYASSPSSSCPPNSGSLCARLSDAISSSQRDSELSAMAYSAAATAAAVGILFWFVWPRDSSPTTSAWLVPSVGDRAAGLAGGGSF
jgi:hypothetical protein